MKGILYHILHIHYWVWSIIVGSFIIIPLPIHYKPKPHIPSIDFFHIFNRIFAVICGHKIFTGDIKHFMLLLFRVVVFPSIADPAAVGSVCGSYAHGLFFGSPIGDINRKPAAVRHSVLAVEKLVYGKDFFSCAHYLFRCPQRYIPAL